MSPVRRFAIVTGATSAAILLSIWLLDRPFATFANKQLRPHGLLLWATEFNWLLQPAAIAVAVVTGVLALRGNRLSKAHAFWLLTAVVYLVNRAVKSDLQIAFGRTWPEPWVDGAPSWIGSGAFYFDPWNGGPGFESFPSGTTASVCAAFALAWFWYPQWRVLYAVPIALVITAILSNNFHFVSDVIAGVYLGFATGWIAGVIWNDQVSSGTRAC